VIKRLEQWRNSKLETWTLKLLLGAILLFAGVLLSYFILSYFFFGILLVIAGLVLLATLPEGATDLRPVGVTAVGVFALLGSMGLSLFSLYTITALTIGGQPFWGLLFSLFVWYYIPVGVFALSSLFFSIVILRGVSSKHLRHALMAYWILLLGYSLFRDFTTNAFGALGSVFPMWFFSTTVYPAVCIAYFLTKKPRQYFHLIAGQPVAQASDSK
jgi:hypothetical protein